MKLSIRICSLLVVAGSLLSSVASAAPTIIPKPPEVAARSYILMDYTTGKILAEHNADERLPPASLTKMMTSYIIGQELKMGNIKHDDKVTVSRAAWAKNFPDSSKMFIEVGKQVTVADLNRGIIIDSGNDACVAMAEYIAGSSNSFADMMNVWAKKLGMTESHFVNPHGLYSKDHYTSARDMAILGQALIRDDPEEYKIYAEKSFTYNGITQYNRNTLLWDKSLHVDGIKTGHVSEIGYNLVASAKQNGMRLISVVMGAKSEYARGAESKKLLTYGFRFYQTLTPYKAGQTLTTQRVWMGDKDEVKLGVSKDVAITIPRGQSKNIEASFELDKVLKAPLKQGETVGSVILKADGKEIAKAPLVSLENVEKGSIFSRFKDYIVLLFKSWFS
ncbi:D-alanyl-D-alanine carboxypeptidase family protein [Dongshaea marina]|uniref:D-alanyl-D-alanine carboxypeptidase family protein n=1 Tax=Dongshaea marina TaxID=2047966 RepID=UPI000D3E8405|nr:D-alanyl-D-alanine carboxypeptidase family protein [Dongshaea marina]